MNHRKTTPRRLIRRLAPLGLWSAVLLAAPALARDIPAEVVRNAGAVDAAGQTAIDTHVKQHVPKLRSESPKERSDARDKLLEPLSDPNVTVAFRQAYSRALLPEIGPLLDESRDHIVINALRIAGKLATEQSTELILTKLDDKLASIRFAAASEIGTTFFEVGSKPPAIREETGIDLARALEKRLREEPDQFVVHRLILSLKEGVAGVRQPTPIRDEALRSLARGVNERLRKLGAQKASDEVIEYYVYAANVVRDGITVGQGGAVPDDALKLAAGMGGQMIAYGVRLVQGGALPTVQRDDPPARKAAKEQLRAMATRLVGAGETVVIFAQRAKNQSAIQPKLAESFKQATNGGDAAFKTDAEAVVGPAGVLVKEPFAIKPDQFPLK